MDGDWGSGRSVAGEIPVYGFAGDEWGTKVLSGAGAVMAGQADRVPGKPGNLRELFDAEELEREGEGVGDGELVGGAGGGVGDGQG